MSKIIVMYRSRFRDNPYTGKITPLTIVWKMFEKNHLKRNQIGFFHLSKRFTYSLSAMNRVQYDIGPKTLMVCMVTASKPSRCWVYIRFVHCTFGHVQAFWYLSVPHLIKYCGVLNYYLHQRYVIWLHTWSNLSYSRTINSIQWWDIYTKIFYVVSNVWDKIAWARPIDKDKDYGHLHLGGSKYLIIVLSLKHYVLGYAQILLTFQNFTIKKTYSHFDLPTPNKVIVCLFLLSHLFKEDAHVGE